MGDQSYKRYTYRAGVDVRLTNDIKLSATVAGNEGKSDQIYTKGARFKLYGMSGSTENQTIVLCIICPTICLGV